MRRYAHIRGWGKYVPERVMTNDDLARIVDTNDEWIRSRTGIAERRIVGETDTTTSMAVKAAIEALSMADCDPSTVELIVVATMTPDRVMPATATAVQDVIGADRAAAFDLGAACSGFVYAYSVASQLVSSGAYKNALVIGAESMSHILDWNDRATCVLFGDGAGAFYLEANESPGGMLAFELGSDGSGGELLTGPTVGNSYKPLCGPDLKLQALEMNGRAVFRFATKIMGKAADAAIQEAGLTREDIDLFIPHQANIRIIESAARQLKLPMEKVYVNIHRYGNTSAASIPVAFVEAVEEGRLKRGDNVVVVGFGGGLTWGAAVVKWVAEPVPVESSGARVARNWFRYQRARIGSFQNRMGHVVDEWIETGARIVAKQKRRRE
ncbi:MAG: ketoacyl-ACP synthase III [Anaerolineales bacterium]|nr:ketoacyl-ACP synthase III [Anaerolineales bacterium]MCB9128653.1 ketoacyl-ACP synthase III [Ardenticatenales bacterium]MCB9172885.1 ketoacyl-ACP synthase III [Ardenticatenales bacterium]